MISLRLLFFYARFKEFFGMVGGNDVVMDGMNSERPRASLLDFRGFMGSMKCLMKLR